MVSDIEASQLSVRAWKYQIGWGLSGLTILFLMIDSIMKLLALPVVLEVGATIGFGGVPMARMLGILLMLCTLLYAAPRTTVLGAILLTGYLGGAVATHLRLGNPLFSHVLFGVYVGIIAWGGVYLRNPNLPIVAPPRHSKRDAR
jgi:hypothetical protein